MYKCLHDFSIKTVPDTSLHETADLLGNWSLLRWRQHLCLRQWKNYHYN